MSGRPSAAVQVCGYPVLAGAGMCCGTAPCSVRWHRLCAAEGGCWDGSMCGDCAEPVFEGDPGYDEAS